MSRSPFRHPAVWYRHDLPSKHELAIELGPRHRDAFASALEHLRASGLPRESLRTPHFPLPGIAWDVASWRREVHEGRGLLVLRGFPVRDLAMEDIEDMYLGLGLHFGRPVSQSNMGDLVGHVVDVGGKDRRQRAYRNSRELHLHTDRCDHVGMLCIRPAMAGGVSGYASALSIHNEMLASRPDLLEHLYEGYRLHRFGEQPPGEDPVTAIPIPIFSECEGVPSVIYIRGYVDLAEEEGHYSLSPSQREALDYFEEVSDREDVRVNFTLEAGEAAFFNNCLVLHTRTAFEDSPDPDLRRHLLRLWLMQDERPAVQGSHLHKGEGGIRPLQGKGTYYRQGGAS